VFYVPANTVQVIWETVFYRSKDPTNSIKVLKERFPPVCERKCFCPYSYHHQHRQSVSHFRSVSSYSQKNLLSSHFSRRLLDNDQVSKYRPISNLSLISEIIERVKCLQLVYGFYVFYLAFYCFCCLFIVRQCCTRSASKQ